MRFPEYARFGVPLRLTFPVYIDSGSARPDAREVAALLADCSAALKDEPCALGDRSGKRPPRRALVVLKGPEAETVAIWVHHGDASVSYRELTFERSDETSERWRAAGLVAASMLLVPERDAAPPPTPEPEPRSPDSATPPARPASAPAAKRERLAVSLAASGSAWASAGPALVGGILGVEVFPLERPVGLCLTGTASKGAKQLASQAGIARQSLGFGLVAVLFPSGPVHLAFRGELLRERLAVTATNGLGETDAGETWRSAGALTLTPTLELGHRLSAQAGAQVAVYDQAPKVISGQTVLTQAGRIGGSAFIGIRVGF